MKIKGTTKVVGLFGYPVAHTLSPIIQNTAFQETDQDLIYLPFSVEPRQLEVATRSILALGMRGVNVTIPHKEQIVRYLDQVSEQAGLVGAVNTVVNREGKLAGYNTDGEGFIESLRRKGYSLRDKEVLIIGAGGAALAISVFLLREGVARLVLINRTYARARKLVSKLESIPTSGTKLELFKFKRRNSFPGKERIDLIINTTSLGMHKGDPSPLDLESFSDSSYIYDIVYNRETQLLHQARVRGMQHQGGLDMLIYQGGLSFKLWTGKEAPVNKMRKIAQEHLGEANL